MATRERPADRGRRLVREALRKLVVDIRNARLSAGLSQRFVAQAVGVSHTQIGRLERGALSNPDLSFVGAVGGVVGLEVSLRAYPVTDALRDRAHEELLERFRKTLHPSLRWRTEVPFSIAGDLRAWDGQVDSPSRAWNVKVEAETLVTDAQALRRRLALKVRDGGQGHLVLLLADTRNNRDFIASMRESVRDLLPLDTRAVLRSLRSGRDPGAGGVVIL